MNKSPKLFLGLSSFYFLFIIALGSWWLYLLVEYASIVEAHSPAANGNIVSMIKWEGASFFLLLILLSASFVGLYLKDIKKTKALQAFFASMTHELKTPLASIRLQAEVLDEGIQDQQQEGLQIYSKRLIEDTHKMEHHMDKILQLSRLEGGATLSSQKVELLGVIQDLAKNFERSSQIKVEIDAQSNSYQIKADEFAIGLILRNLFENTQSHTNSTSIIITLKNTKEGTTLIYCDHGNFSGENKKLGTLFYKHNSKKGSGIGLYLIGSLMQKMSGSFKINSHEGALCFSLSFNSDQRFNT